MRYSKDHPDPLLRQTQCPECRRFLNAATSIEGKRIGQAEPDPGDFTLCAYCGSLLRFDADDEGLILVKCSDSDEIPNELIELHLKWLQYREEKSKHERKTL